MVSYLRSDSGSGRVNAKTSTGVGASLTGERRKVMEACAEKARTTFPPAFVNQNQLKPF